MAGQSTGTGTGTASPATPVAPPPATSVVFWDANPEAYVQLRDPGPWLRGKLAGQVIPGLFKVKVTPAKRKVDAQTPPAKGGAKIVVKGWTPASVTITITLWTPTQFEQWQQIKPLLRVDTDKKDPIAILHPVAEESSIFNILVESISGIEDGSIQGTKEITITGTDSGKPKETGSGTATNGKGTTGDDNIKKGYFAAYTAYVTSIKSNSGGGGYWLEWATWITQQGAPQYAKPVPVGYAAWAPPGSPGT